MSRTIVNDLKVTSALRAKRHEGVTRANAANGVESLEREFLQEMAYSLKRAEDKLLDALDAVEEAFKASQSASPQTRGWTVKRYNKARDAAKTARWEMIVHREAIGMRDAQHIRERYPIPPRLNA